MEPLNGIAKLTVLGTTDCKWEIVTPHYRTKSGTLKGRYGFQGYFYDSKLYFFFGCQVYDKMRLERTCLNEIVIFDPYTNEASVKLAYHTPERLLKPRKYFSGFMLEGTFFSHGGIESNGKVLNEFISVNLDTLEWRTQPYERGPPILLDQKESAHASSCKGHEEFPDYVYGHKMVPIMYKRKVCRIDELSQPDYGAEEAYMR
jgi:hypothetical protein